MIACELVYFKILLRYGFHYLVSIFEKVKVKESG